MTITVCGRPTSKGAPCQSSRLTMWGWQGLGPVPESCPNHLTAEERARRRSPARKAVAPSLESRTPACHTWPTPSPGTPWREWQRERCGVCGYTGNLVVDHCHDTGFERGFLCRGCNVSEGAGSSEAIERYRVRPPAVICGATRPYWSPFLGSAEPHPGVVAAFGFPPDRPEDAADYLRRVAENRGEWFSAWQSAGSDRSPAYRMASLLADHRKS